MNKGSRIVLVSKAPFAWGDEQSDSKEPIRHAAFTDKQLALSVLNDHNDSVSQNDNEVKPSAALSEPAITCEWSESNYFEDGKTYSVAEFDALMEQADSEMVAEHQRLQ